MSGAVSTNETRPIRLGLLVIDSIDEPHRSIAGDYPELYTSAFADTGVVVDPVDVRDAQLPDHGERGAGN